MYDKMIMMSASQRMVLRAAIVVGDLEKVVSSMRSGLLYVDLRFEYGDTLLHKAAAAGNVEVVSKLFELGANFNARNVYGDTPLHKAAAVGNVEVVSKLLELGANFNVWNNYGKTPADVAAAEVNEPFSDNSSHYPDDMDDVVAPLNPDVVAPLNPDVVAPLNPSIEEFMMMILY